MQGARPLGILVLEPRLSRRCLRLPCPAHQPPAHSPAQVRLPGPGPSPSTPTCQRDLRHWQLVLARTRQRVRQPRARRHAPHQLVCRCLLLRWRGNGEDLRRWQQVDVPLVRAWEMRWTVQGRRQCAPPLQGLCCRCKASPDLVLASCSAHAPQPQTSQRSPRSRRLLLPSSLPALPPAAICPPCHPVPPPALRCTHIVAPVSAGQLLGVADAHQRAVHKDAQPVAQHSGLLHAARHAAGRQACSMPHVTWQQAQCTWHWLLVVCGTDRECGADRLLHVQSLEETAQAWELGLQTNVAGGACGRTQTGQVHRGVARQGAGAQQACAVDACCLLACVW